MTVVDEPTVAVPPVPDELPTLWRHPKQYFDAAIGDQMAFPLLILFLLNTVDELDRSAFGILVPEIRDAFGLDNQGILGVVAIVTTLALGVQPFVGYLADRRSRVRIAVGGAAGWAFFSLMTGFAPTVGLLVLARCGSSLGRIVVGPTHDSLLSDYYEPNSRPAVFGFHRAGNSIGQFIGPLAAGFLASWFSWRVPFVILSIPTVILVVIAGSRLREPKRGRFEQEDPDSVGPAATTDMGEDRPPSFGEAFRICWEVRTVRRIWMSLPFLALSLIGLVSLTSIFYEDIFDVSEAGRGTIAAIAEPFQLVGILIFIPISTKMIRKDPASIVRLVGITGSIGSAFLVLYALSPSLPLAVAANICATSVLGAITPGIAAVLSLTLPPRARSVGFSLGSLFSLLGVPILLIIGGVADSGSIRIGMVVLVPIFLFGCFMVASAAKFVNPDIAKVRASARGRAEVARAKAEGRQKLLLVKGLDVAYGSVQVLFDVDFEVEQGEVIALLGTNGAGKSTLLRAISGLQPAKAGAVIFDGEDITFAKPQEVAAQGVVQVPGGKGVFPGLTVEENLRIAGWLYQKDKKYVDDAIERVLDMFPVLRERYHQPAGLLSGGEQQMVTLSQAFIAKPKLLMIDELSLGLAPVIVEQLLHIVRAMRDDGITLILVEQSVNVALTVAETAYFMEKGEIRFKGPTKELLERPDVLRSVFLEGASAGGQGSGADGHSTNGHGSNGHGSNGHGSNGHGSNGHGSPADLEPYQPGRRRRAPLRAGDTHRIEIAPIDVPPAPPITAPTPSVIDLTSGPALAVRGLHKSFGGITATNEVSFELHRGEILGFIGPNGAGKTTLFDQISGYLAPDSGVIELNGIDVTSAPPDARARLGLGRSFQDAKLYPTLTVRDALALSFERRLPVRDPIAAALHLPIVKAAERAVRAQADDLIELMGLTAFADKFVGELSTGSRRVVDLACIVAHEPKVILFDEPSSGIAQRETEALGPLIQRIRASTDASVLVIEHDMPLITSISDRLVALDLGRVIVTGTPTEVINHPEVISAYLGTDDAVIARSGGK